MEAIARTTGIRVSTRKVRLVADAIRNMPVAKAMQVLMATQKHGASVLIKTLKSAVANAVQKGAQEEDLVIARLDVDGGPTLRRMHIGSRSHVRMYTKRSTHVRIVVSDAKKTAKPAVQKEVQKLEKPAVAKAKAGKKEETK